MYRARAQFFSSFDEMPSIPIDMETSRDYRAFRMSSWGREILSIVTGGSGKVSIDGRQCKLVVKTE